MNAKEIRSKFFDYFKSKSHTFVKSAPIFPKDDPSLLFTNAGMNQFKDIFLGNSNTDNLKRVVNSQKCMRVSGKHNDLEEVGKDGTHHTFFEMLGNWSFGDYYKEDAIKYGWDILTNVFKLPKEQLYATVFTDDAEAFSLWENNTDINKNHIIRLGEKDNFWEMGKTGPCGPCSEIHIDLGEKLSCGSSCNVSCDCGRFIEIWNLVFIQYNREEDGSLKELKNKHIDTGMGFERLVRIIQNKESNYDTELFMPIINKLVEMSSKEYESGENGVPFRVIADHIRALTVAIADGVLPSNEGRGYVIRRILRRAYRFGRKLDFNEPFLFRLVPKVSEILGSVFPEIKDRLEFIQKVVEAEENSFERTLDKGLLIFEDLKKSVKESGKKVLSGKDIFKLYDTYGFPYDLTNQIASENGLSIDKDEFDSEMEKQRTRARSGAKFKDMNSNKASWIVLSNSDSTEFTGYTSLVEDMKVVKYRETKKGFDIVTDKTPFYAQSGGQAGDTGTITVDDKVIKIVETKKEGVATVHIGISEKNIKLSESSILHGVVNKEQRDEIRRNHTATHILQYALQKVLGKHVAQSGSSHDQNSLRFDYTHFSALTEKELEEVEKICNGIVIENRDVESIETSFAEAKSMGAMALFSEKYGDNVRVVKIEDKSIELCGGTHVSSTGEIGYINIISETSIASGIRRIEAITGKEFGNKFREDSQITSTITRSLKLPFKKIPDYILTLSEKLKSTEKELKELKRKNMFGNISELVEKSEEVAGVKVVKELIKDFDKDSFAQKAEEIKRVLKSGIVLLFAENSGRAVISVDITDDLIASNSSLSAGKVVQKLAEIVGGKGGGRPNRAQAGGKDPSKLTDAFNKSNNIIKDFI